MTNETKSPKLFAFFGGVVVALIYLGLVIFLQFYSSIEETQQKTKKTVKETVEDVLKEKLEPKIPDYNAATGSGMKLLNIASDHVSYVKKDGGVVGRIDRKIKLSGRIVRGYILVEASVDAGSTLTAYDSIFAILGFEGGHLLRNRSLDVPPSRHTLLLYALSNIPNLTSVPYDESKISRSANWHDLLNTNETLRFQSFLSSQRTGGKIHQLFIGYECAEETADCLLNFVE